MIISFVGHSSVCSSEKLKELLKEQIRKSICDAEYVGCYLGGYGGFDEICASVCRELKKEYGCIELVYITPYISLSAQAKIKENEQYGLYDKSIYPPIENTPPRFAILKRNEWMVENSDLIIGYVNHDWGGAYKTLQFAKRRKKKIINICDFL